MSTCISEFCISATVQFLEVKRIDHGSVQSYDPDVQQRVAATAFTVVCEEVSDLIIARLPVRDLVRTKSVCKALRACCDANCVLIHSKYFRRKQLETKMTKVTDWYFLTSRVGGEKSVTNGLEMRAWVGLHHPSNHVLSLPSFTFLPFSLKSMVMMIVAGGLVCFQKLPPASFDPAVHVSSGAASLEVSTRYRTFDFIICNPLTRKWQRLPSITPIVANLSLLKLLVADPKNYSQEYYFLLLGRDVSWKYSSLQHTWENVDHHHKVWNSSELQPTTTITTAAAHGKFVNGSGGSAIFKGRLYCLSISSTTYLPQRQLHAIHQFDLQTLIWLDDLIWSRHLGATDPINTVPHPYVGAQPATMPLQPESLLNPQLVVCTSTLFAVLPILELNTYRADYVNNPLTSRAARYNIHGS
jgi:hypothetical protein